LGTSAHEEERDVGADRGCDLRRLTGSEAPLSEPDERPQETGRVRTAATKAAFGRDGLGKGDPEPWQTDVFFGKPPRFCDRIVDGHARPVALERVLLSGFDGEGVG